MIYTHIIYKNVITGIFSLLHLTRVKYPMLICAQNVGNQKSYYNIFLYVTIKYADQLQHLVRKQ